MNAPPDRRARSLRRIPAAPRRAGPRRRPPALWAWTRRRHPCSSRRARPDARAGRQRPAGRWRNSRMPALVFGIRATLTFVALRVLGGKSNYHQGREGARRRWRTRRRALTPTKARLFGRPPARIEDRDLVGQAAAPAPEDEIGPSPWDMARATIGSASSPINLRSIETWGFSLLGLEGILVAEQPRKYRHRTSARPARKKLCTSLLISPM